MVVEGTRRPCLRYSNSRSLSVFSISSAIVNIPEYSIISSICVVIWSLQISDFSIRIFRTMGLSEKLYQEDDAGLAVETINRYSAEKV